jgi:hypothetical protein
MVAMPSGLGRSMTHNGKRPNKWLERAMLGVTSLAGGKRRAARSPLSHTVRHADHAWQLREWRWYVC